MQVSDQIIRSLFNHLARSYTAEEACEIMIQKYPHAEGDIRILMQHGYTPEQEETVMNEVNVVESAPALVEIPAADIKAAIKAKTAKAKPVKAAKPVRAPKVKTKAPKAPKASKGPSKMDRARTLYAVATDKSRKAMIELFGRELGLGQAAASTYYYTVKS